MSEWQGRELEAAGVSGSPERKNMELALALGSCWWGKQQQTQPWHGFDPNLITGTARLLAAKMLALSWWQILWRLMTTCESVNSSTFPLVHLDLPKRRAPLAAAPHGTAAVRVLRVCIFALRVGVISQ